MAITTDAEFLDNALFTVSILEAMNEKDFDRVEELIRVLTPEQRSRGLLMVSIILLGRLSEATHVPREEILQDIRVRMVNNSVKN
jgi:hypothetical protein